MTENNGSSSTDDGCTRVMTTLLVYLTLSLTATNYNYGITKLLSTKLAMDWSCWT